MCDFCFHNLIHHLLHLLLGEAELLLIICVVDEGVGGVLEHRILDITLNLRDRYFDIGLLVYRLYLFRKQLVVLERRTSLREPPHSFLYVGFLQVLKVDELCQRSLVELIAIWS